MDVAISIIGLNEASANYKTINNSAVYSKCEILQNHHSCRMKQLDSGIKSRDLLAS